MIGTQPNPTENATRSVTILGATGSIGSSTLAVIAERPGEFVVEAVTAFSNLSLIHI